MLRALRGITAGLKEIGRAKQRLVLSDNGVALYEDGAEAFQFRWLDVSKVEVWKRDLGVVDMICLDFFVDADRMLYTTNDEMEGFSDLSSCLVKRFPSIAPDWWSEVAFPAFAANHKVLYKKQGA